MIVRVIILALAIFLLLKLVSYVKRQPPAQRKAILWKYSGLLVLAIAILLVATGRLHWVGAAIAAVLPFVRNIGGALVRLMPVLNWVRQQRFANPVMSSRFVQLVVNVGNGSIGGEILAGKHQGASLDSLSEEQLRDLLQDYQQQDPESARLLGAYMQRRFQQQYSQQQSNGGGAGSGGGSMSRKEALQILGLQETASQEDIIKAHRSLMQKFHPDRGGSDYLAAKINQAKDFLLTT